MPLRVLIFLCTLLVGAGPNVLRAQSLPNASDLGELQERIRAAIKRVAPATVGIRNKKDGQGGEGSGVIVTADGLVLTAAHCIQAPGATSWVVLANGRVVKAKNLGKGNTSDAGLVQIIGEGPWPFVPLGESKNLSRRQLCLALGHPGGFSSSRGPVVRMGSILGFRSDHGEFLRTTCVVRPGDSGGPLVDLDGRVIGIHSNISASLRENYHVPANVYRRDWKRMMAGKLVKPRRKGKGKGPSAAPYLGLKCRNTAAGCEVIEIAPKSSASSADLQTLDIIVSLDGVPVTDRKSLRRRVRESRVGDFLKVTLLRGGRVKRITIELMARHQKGGKTKPTAPARISAGDSQTESVQNQEENPSSRTAERKIASWLREGHRLTELFERQAKPIQAALCQISWGRAKKTFQQSGLVISADGEILTKASELEKAGDKFKVKLRDGREFEGSTLARDLATDLCLLRIEATEIAAFSPLRGRRHRHLAAGDLILSFSQLGTVESGVLSVAPRALPRSKGGYMGLNFTSFDDYGAVVSSLEADSPAGAGGLSAGDAILGINGKEVKNAREAKAAMRAFSPGDIIELRCRRGVEEMTFEVEVGEAPAQSMGPGARGRKSATSRHRGPYPWAYLHDAIVTPEGCVGPVTDLAGRFIGLNISRASRTDTVALTTGVVVDALQRLRAQAARHQRERRLKRLATAP